VARRFDDALRALRLTDGQFSLRSIAHSRPASGRLLAMSAALKPLQRRGLLDAALDPADRRSRSMTLTAAGRAVLAQAIAICQRTHAKLDWLLGDVELSLLRQGLKALCLPQGASVSAQPSPRSGTVTGAPYSGPVQRLPRTTKTT
jgi:hypothetical protein